MSHFRDPWQDHTVAVDAGTLSYTVFPGPQPFISATSLDGRPLAPVNAHELLEQAGHEHTDLGFIGDNWVA